MRSFLCVTVLFSLFSFSFAAGLDGPDLTKNGDGRFQMLAIGGRAMLLDRQSGKSWLLAAKGDKAAWIPIQRLGDSLVASNWLKANLPARPGGLVSTPGSVSRTEAERQVRLERISNSEVAAEPYSVLVARERASLTQLKAEYGDRHPEVMASRNRLKELLKVGDGKEKE